MRASISPRVTVISSAPSSYWQRALDGTLVTMVTGSMNKLSLEHDYPIREWKAAGLDKPSIARLDRIAEIPAGYLGTTGRIGRLADSDITAIRAILADITR